MPGSLPSSMTRRWTGGASSCLPLLAPRGPVGSRAAARKPTAEPAEPAERVERRGRVHAAGAGQLALQLHRLAQRLVDRGHDHVLQHLDVLGVDGVGVDRERLELEVAAHRDLDHAAAGRSLDELVLELLLSGQHLFLHLLRLLQQRSEVGRLGHHDSSSAGSSSASNSRMKASTSSSSESSALACSAVWASSSASAYASRSELPVTVRIAVAICWRHAGSSALRFENAADSAQLSVSSPPSSAYGRAFSIAACSTGLRSFTSARTAGHNAVRPGRSSSTPTRTSGSLTSPSGWTTATAVTAGPPSISAEAATS